jgi:hypothetical protein
VIFRKGKKIPLDAEFSHPEAWFKIYLSSVVLCDFKQWEVAFSILETPLCTLVTTRG